MTRDERWFKFENGTWNKICNAMDGWAATYRSKAYLLTLWGVTKVQVSKLNGPWILTQDPRTKIRIQEPRTNLTASSMDSIFNENIFFLRRSRIIGNNIENRNNIFNDYCIFSRSIASITHYRHILNISHWSSDLPHDVFCTRTCETSVSESDRMLSCRGSSEVDVNNAKDHLHCDRWGTSTGYLQSIANCQYIRRQGWYWGRAMRHLSISTHYQSIPWGPHSRTENSWYTCHSWWALQTPWGQHHQVSITKQHHSSVLHKYNIASDNFTLMNDLELMTTNNV